MRRREFITLIGGAATTWPMIGHAQQSAIPVIGFLRSISFVNATHLVNAFREGLKESGFVEGQNVAIEFRTADGHADRLLALVDELIRLPVAVIVGNTIASALAAKAATTTIPIVFTTGSDPVRDGLVTSLNRPGGNVTGAVFFSGELGAKRLELLSQLMPNAPTIAMLVNPNSPETEAERSDVQAAAQSNRQSLIMFDVSNERDFERAFETFVQRGARALLVGAGPFLFSNRERVIALAARYRLPAIYALRDNVVAGGLMSYGSTYTDVYRQVGIYTGRILNGEKPADLPVIRATKFEFVLNLRLQGRLASLYRPRYSRSPTRSSNETARVHHAAERCCRMAACGGRAATRADAADRRAERFCRRRSDGRNASCPIQEETW